ncbi:hypothetical protein CHUAL_008314 [Chamberlinius hualienensis]
MRRIIYTAVCLLAVISTVSSQCCDFDSAFCSFDGTWLSTSNKQPNLLSYPNFASTEPSSNYIFLQNSAGTQASNTQFHISAAAEVISFDYFFDSPTKDPYNELQVYFEKNDGSFAVMLAYVQVQSGSWGSISIRCDNTNAYCCGGYDFLPCDGILKVTGLANPTNPEALFAISNIGLCGENPTTTIPPTTTTTTIPPTTTKTTTPTTTPTSPPTTTTTTTPPTTPTTTTAPPTTTTPPTTSTTTTTPTTTPTPLELTCCNFDDDSCNAYSSKWYWSQQRSPTSYIPSPNGDYSWTNVSDNQFFLPTAYNVNPNTNFGFSYYVNSNNAALNIYFNPVDDVPTQIGHVSSTGSAWKTFSAVCGACCDGKTCDGQISIESSGNGNFIVGVDNVQVDGQCHDSFSCCYFNDKAICGYTSANVNGYKWQPSHTSKPVNPPVSPESDYVYFETIDYSQSQNLNVILRSTSIKITETIVYRANVYADFDNTNSGNELRISFYNSDRTADIRLATIANPSKNWTIVELECTTETCCKGYARCSGTLEITAFVHGTVGGTVMYAVDALEILNTCGEFPG